MSVEITVIGVITYERGLSPNEYVIFNVAMTTVVLCRARVTMGPRYRDRRDFASGRSGGNQGVYAHEHVHQRCRRYRLPEHRARLR